MAFDSNIKGYMTFGKSFSRGGAFPLEAYEIWTDYDALVAYAANTNPDKDPSYIGQKVAYVDKTNNKVTHYGIEIDGTLKELGAAPVGDGKSISVDANGAISLLGIESADSLTLPRMKEDKSGIEWVPVSAVVQGDGNDNTTYTFTPVTKGEGEDAETYGFIVKTFFNGTEVEGGEFTLGFDVYTKSEVDAAIKEVADLVGVPAEDDDSTDTLYERIAAEVLRATNAESALSDRIGVAKDGETAATGVYAYVDGIVNALVNGVDPDKIDSLNELIAWVEAHPDIVSGLDERLENVEGILDGFGGEEQPATVKGYVDDKFATKQEITDAGYAVATDVVDNSTFEEFKTTNSKAIEDAVAAHETAVAGTYATKAELKATDDIAKDAQNRVGIVEGKIDEITSVGGEPNVIEKIKVNGITLEVEKDSEGKSTKTVSIAVPTDITTMDGYSDLNTRVTTNANSVSALNKQLANTNTNVSNNTTEIGKINRDITVNIKPAIEALEGADTVIEGTLAEHTTAIKTLNDTTIPGLSGQIAGEVTAREEAVKDINDKIGTVEAGKTVVDMINAVAGTIDFTPYAKKDEVAATYATIAALETVYKVDGETKSGVIVDLVNAEKARAEAAEKKNADDIAAINTLLNAVDSEDTITSLKELAIWVEAHDTEVIPVVNQHSEDIADLKTRVAANETAVGTTLPAAIAQALTDAKAYTDQKMVKADGTSIVNNEGTFSVGAVSTDNLVQGQFTLVLNGGDAQVTA